MDKLNWYYTKDDLYKTIDNNTNYVILAKDSKQDSGSKQYTKFDSATDMISTIKNGHLSQHFNEVIPDMQNYPCYVFFDLDRELHERHIINNIQNYSKKLIDTFESIFTRFIKDIYQQDIVLEKGANYQVLYTPITKSKTKLSLHIKVNIICSNLSLLKCVVSNFDKYMSSNLYVTSEEREYFYYYKMKQNTKIYDSVIDKGIYTNFRCLRMLYSSKWKTDAVQCIPSPGFSPDIKDHLVLVHKDIEQSTIPVTLTNINIDIDADYSKVERIAIKSERVVVDDDGSDSISDVTPNINSKHLEQIEDCILNDTVIHKLFGPIRFKYSNFISPTVYAFAIDKSCGCLCPYVERVHDSNRSYLEYHYKHNILKYKCFNEECQCIQKKECIIFKVRPELDTLQRLTNLNTVATLHCKQNIIGWNDTYNQESMRSYPLKPLTCVRGNMGSAKTKCLIEDFIGKNCMNPSTKCLFITYQILLSKKYFNALEIYGFTNYMNHTDTYINSNKVIICLDSLWRITTKNFDYIFIDEVLSVLLHFNSSLMKQIHKISALFELLLLQAKYIYVLDACVDNTLVYDFVNYLSIAKNISTFWIRNTHVRPTNRECQVIINRSTKNAKQQASLKYSCFNKVANLLKINKKVVISSSTKTFTKDLMEYIKTKCSDKKIIVYNSDTDKNIIYEHAIDPNNIWNTYDALIYSPTISAGLSFEILHFDELICYINNSFYTPTVDLILQQMFRVRQLVSGKMTLFINDCLNISQLDYPVSEEAVEEWLDKNMMVMQKYFPSSTLSYEASTQVTINGLNYDKTRLSYHILKGIITNINKSLIKFTDIITNTLKDDYNIPCKIVEFAPKESVLQEAFELFEKLKKERIEQQIQFDELLVIGHDEYSILANKRDNLSEEEKMKKWIFEVGVNLWQVSPKIIDKEFFDTFIGQPEPNQMKITFDRFFKALRYKELDRTLDENRERMRNAIEVLVESSSDFNIELFKTKTKTYYEKLLEGQYLLKQVFNIEGGKLDAKQMYETEKIQANCQNYADSLNGERWRNIVSMFGLNKRTYSSLNKFQESQSNQLNFLKQILKGAFNMDYKLTTDRVNKKAATGSLDIDWFLEMANKYKPMSIIKPERNEWSFISQEDEYDPLES
jgi:hypothetical protein